MQQLQGIEYSDFYCEECGLLRPECGGCSTVSDPDLDIETAALNRLEDLHQDMAHHFESDMRPEYAGGY